MLCPGFAFDCEMIMGTSRDAKYVAMTINIAQRAINRDASATRTEMMRLKILFLR